jgi:hypothetical protein
METKKFTQFGTFSIVLLLSLLVFSVILILLSGVESNFEISILSFLILAFLICLSIFYKLTITVKDTHVSFKLGIGLIHKKYRLSDIESCKPVKNPFWYGIGIRLTPSGWLYNVSGRYAIELTFKNKKSKIRIGTNMPDLVSKAINDFLEKSDSEFVHDSTHRTNKILIWSILLIIIMLPLIMIISGSRDTKLDFTATSFEINGLYGMTIDYSKIIQIDTINSLPRIVRRTNGFAFGKTLKGNFKLSDQTGVKLFIKKGIAPYIFIRTKDAQIYLNFSNPKKTLTTYIRISKSLTLNN